MVNGHDGLSWASLPLPLLPLLSRNLVEAFLNQLSQHDSRWYDPLLRDFPDGWLQISGQANRHLPSLFVGLWHLDYS
jgi:hypothetical protein